MKAKLPGFADWRWNTLNLALKALMPILPSLALHFNPRPFSGARAGVGLQEIVGAFSDPLFQKQAEFMAWYCEWLCNLMQWGSGCDCHVDHHDRGERNIECAWKGRRIRTAHRHIVSNLGEHLAEANGWDDRRWGLGFEALMEIQGVVRSTCELAHRKWAFLARLPYLLARLEEPQVKTEVFAQWASAPPSAHHRVTREFLEGPLREDIDRLKEDGSGASRRLHQEVMSLAALPFDDAVGEGPHAKAKRVLTHSRSCNWAWVASTCRLDQNIAEVRRMLPALDAQLSPLWCNWKSILRTAGPPLRNPKVSPAKVRDYVYRMSFCHEPSRGCPPSSGAGVGVGADQAIEDDEGPGEADGAPIGRALVAQWSGRAIDEVSDDDGAGGEATREGSSAGGRRGRGGQEVGFRRKFTEEARLLRQWLSASLEVHIFVGLLAPGDDGALEFSIFQVLSMECKGIFTKTFLTAEEAVQEQGIFSISVQPFER